MPEECDQLLNLQSIIHQKDEEIHCGDLFGSKYLFKKKSYFSLLSFFS
jgi:hypothetical protein